MTFYGWGGTELRLRVLGFRGATGAYTARVQTQSEYALEFYRYIDDRCDRDRTCGYR